MNRVTLNLFQGLSSDLRLFAKDAKTSLRRELSRTFSMTLRTKLYLKSKVYQPTSELNFPVSRCFYYLCTLNFKIYDFG